MNYVSLPSETTTTIDLKNADYILIGSSSGGHGSNVTTGVDADHFNVPRELRDRVVGTVGSRDASMILIDVRGLDKYKFDGKNENNYSLIHTNKNIEIVNKSSRSNTNGYVDPQKKKGEQINMPSGADALIYKEDEGSYQNRIDALAKHSDVYFNKGQDNALTMSDNSIPLSGNGAIMGLRFY